MTDFSDPEVAALTAVICRAIQKGRVHDVTLAEAIHDAGWRHVAEAEPSVLGLSGTIDASPNHPRTEP